MSKYSKNKYATEIEAELHDEIFNDDIDAWWIDEHVFCKIKELMETLSSKYNIVFSNPILDIDFYCNLIYRDFFAERTIGNPQMWRKAKDIYDILNLRGSGTIKGATGKVDLSKELFSMMKNGLQEYWGEIENILSYCKENEIKDEIYKMAKAEQVEENENNRQYFKYKFVGYIKSMKNAGIFSDKVKKLRDNEGSFLYDLFYYIKNDLSEYTVREITPEWQEPSEPDSAEKRRTISKYL